MRLTSFRIQKYRSIEDSGEISVDENVTTFVGINESGKTNILRALKKINHVQDTKFDDLTEQPTWHYEDFNSDEIFVTATFKLNEEEREQVKDISNGTTLNEIKFSKKKNMKPICHLESDQKAISFSSFAENYLSPIYSLIQNIDSSFDNGDAHKQNLIKTLDAIGNGIETELNVRQPQFLKKVKTRIEDFENALASIPDDILNKTKVKSLLDKISNEVVEDSVDEIKNYLIKKIPRFIYFENTEIIDSRIHLPTFIQKLDNNNMDREDKTAKTLLDLGQLDAHQLYKLRSEEGDREVVKKNKDKLARILDLASKKVSEEIDSLWTSNEHYIEFQVQGDDLRVWVINKEDRIKFPLEERSRGYQWYFSFYTVFNVESEQNHKDAIILLDEPALFLHAKGQEDFLNKTLPILVKKNQIIYTTHSSSMIDLSKPESIHTVTLKEESISGNKQKASHISNEVWDSDRDALFPLQSALHYTMAQSMFIGRKNLIVEGISDFWLLSSASILLESAGKTHLKDDFVFVPAGGATKSVLFAATYKAQNLDVAVLLDADKEGKNAYEHIVKNKILIDKKVCMINDIFNKLENMSIEDIFPQDYYLKFVQLAYSRELEEKGIKGITPDSQNPMIVKRIEDFFKKNNLGEFHKSRPNRVLLSQ